MYKLLQVTKTCFINRCLYKKAILAILDSIAGNKLVKKTSALDRFSLPHIILADTTDNLRLRFV